MTRTPEALLAFFNFSGWELAIILVFGLLIWGKNLPGLGRSVGKTIVEFKNGLADIPSDSPQVPPPAQGSYSPPQSLPGNTGASSTQSTQSQRQA